MTAVNRIVLDASVGVKWFRDEPGSAEARELLLSHGRGQIELVVPSLFVYEVIAVAARSMSSDDTGVFWERFMSWRLSVVEVGGELVREALGVSEQLECSFYDAVAPALALRMGSPLYSADCRAHSELPGVVLVGREGAGPG